MAAKKRTKKYSRLYKKQGLILRKLRSVRNECSDLEKELHDVNMEIVRGMNDARDKGDR